MHDLGIKDGDLDRLEERLLEGLAYGLKRRRDVPEIWRPMIRDNIMLVRLVRELRRYPIRCDPGACPVAMGPRYG